VDGLTFHLLVTGLTSQDRPERLPAQLVGDPQAARDRVRVPPLSPVHEEREHRKEVQALVGQPVGIPIGVAAVAGEDAEREEPAQPFAEDAGGDAQLVLKIGEPPDPQEGRHQQHGAPPVAEDLEGLGEIGGRVPVLPVADRPAMVAGHGDVAEGGVRAGHHRGVPSCDRRARAMAALQLDIRDRPAGLVPEVKCPRLR
jgi:hypothetical protein